ncbi:hypothetical protein [Clostridium estertheticum]|uniref:hypothetical protein n=1 Tax=Clostridium estertheticum TaxID=238834 RepID=UPI001CF47FDA|nr:hypothetical protein [Clostridium estertheticum]MCB2354352.1 hypothetical protein [Clostridium estertheticum]WAG42529.1 hypothetical protein LL065_07605 [Clostridium estertheticum]
MVDKNISSIANVYQEALIANAKVEVLVKLLCEKGIITEEGFNSNVNLIMEAKDKEYKELINEEKEK